MANNIESRLKTLEDAVGDLQLAITKKMNVNNVTNTNKNGNKKKGPSKNATTNNAKKAWNKFLLERYTKNERYKPGPPNQYIDQQAFVIVFEGEDGHVTSTPALQYSAGRLQNKQRGTYKSNLPPRNKILFHTTDPNAIRTIK